MNCKSRKNPKLLIFLCWLTYATAYLGRYSYNANVNAIMEEFSVNHRTTGLVTTFFFFAYGVGQIVHGLLSRRYPKKYAVSGALILSAAFNLAVFLGVPFPLFKYLWMLNGIVQALLWPSLIGLLGEQLEERDLSRAVLVISTAVASGTLIIYGISALLSHLGAYKLVFLVSPILLTAVAIVWFFSYDRCVGAPIDLCKKSEEGPSSQRLPKTVFLTLAVVLCLFAAANNLIRDGLTTWTPAILKEEFSLGDGVSVLLTLILPLFAACAALLNAGVEKLTKEPIPPCAVYFALTSGLFFCALRLRTGGHSLPMLLCMGVSVLLMSAVNIVVTGSTPLYLRRNADPGLLAGLFNGFCYVGSTVSSYGLGAVADSRGWSAVFLLLAAVSGAATVIALFAMAMKALGKRKGERGK